MVVWENLGEPSKPRAEIQGKLYLRGRSSPTRPLCLLCLCNLEHQQIHFRKSITPSVTKAWPRNNPPTNSTQLNSLQWQKNNLKSDLLERSKQNKYVH